MIKIRDVLSYITVIFIFVSALQGSAVAQDSLDYPEAGSGELASPCERKNQPQWVQFYCNYMTIDLWNKAGRPLFKSKNPELVWVPFYYKDVGNKYARNDGLLEGLRLERLTNSEVRYTPWSVYFKEKMGCLNSNIVNPYKFSQKAAPRSRFLAFGWKDAVIDGNDPTQVFEPGAMFVLFSLANLHVWGIENWANSDHVRFGYYGYLKPDYQRDAEVWLINPNGEKKKLENLDEAAQELYRVGMMYTNDSISTWKRGFKEALGISQNKNRPFIYIYLAQDIFYAWSDNSIYRKRLKYLIDEAVKMCDSSQEYCIGIMSYGWSSHIVASTVMNHPNVMHFPLNPSHGPWGNEEYLNAIGKAKTKIIHSDHDFVSTLGLGAANISREKCL